MKTSFSSRRRAACLALPLSLLACIAGAQPESDWPSKPVRWIVPYPAGGPLDAIARKVGDAVAGQIGQPVLIDNRTGAYGSLGATEVVRSRPDGYTFLMSSPDTFINAMVLLKSPPYDARKDFTYLTQIAESGAVLMLRGDAPETTLAQLVTEAKAKPGHLSYGSWGAGSYTHLLMEGLSRRAGVELLHVPYRGAMPAVQDLLGKQLSLTFGPANLAMNFAQQGSVKLLAVSGDKRSPLLPSVPTFEEAGYTDPIFRTRVWFGLAAPAGLPPAIGDAMVRQVQRALAKPEVARFITDAGFTVVGNTPREFRMAFDAEYPLMTRMIREAGVQPQ